MSLAIVQLTSTYMSFDVCYTAALVIHFSLIACFFWLNVICIETYTLVHRYTRGNNIMVSDCNKKREFFYYSLWAWGSTAFFVVVTLYMKSNPIVPAIYVKQYFGYKSCWSHSDKGAKLLFYVPLSLLICMNLVLVVRIALEIIKFQRKIELRQFASNIQSVHKERWLKHIVFLCLGLFSLMGINWMIELASWWVGSSWHACSAFDIINALQGTVVFGLFVIRSPLRTIIWYNLVRRFEDQRAFQDSDEP
ncbi:G-protein coupled receptor Mth2 [Copidosoma floridanum]|uniref:G-protein coupled receptor Mth2 n=1 Tax=Copidosoma floridanum TaxID=29053 RepID=UPI0006C95843|nr:G-protein coupled receptor Mth2 [Copidosoma floridanum]